MKDFGALIAIGGWLAFSAFGGILIADAFLENEPCPVCPPQRVITEAMLKSSVFTWANSKVCHEHNGVLKCVKIIKLKDQPSQ